MGITGRTKCAILWVSFAIFLLVTLPLAAQADFTISASPTTLSVPPGTVGTVTITTTISGGFDSSITLSAAGVPLGAMVSFNPTTIPAPGAGNSTMTITVLRLAMKGTYPITVTGSGGGNQHTVIVTLNVPGPGSFTLSASPSSLTIVQGNQGTSTITTSISGGFNSAISLSASGVPADTQVDFNPPSIPAPGAGNSTMTITVGNDTPVGTYPIIVTGTGGGIQQYATVTLTVAAPGDFTISASPPALTIAQGNQDTSTITTTISGGFNSSISLSYSGAPSGTQVNFNPPSIPAPGAGNSTMTITVGNNTPVGTYPIIVTGSGGGIQHNVTVTLTVVAPPSFTISADPSSLSVVQGNQGTSLITTTISGGFNSSISLSYTGAPSGVGVTFDPPSIPAPGAGNSTMTITVAGDAAPGTYPITVTGNGGGIQQNVTVTLTVTVAGNFTISASPSSLTVVQGTQGISTITTAVSGGFNSSISLSYSGAPANTTVTFDPPTIPAPGAGNSTMTITVDSSTPVGTYPITVTGNGGGIQHNVIVTLTVVAPPDFVLSANPSSLSVVQGDQGTSTITATISGGFNDSISLTYSGAPSGVGVTFNPTSIPAPGAGNSTMTITVASDTTPGTYPITVTGDGGGLERYVTVTLTVTPANTFTISASPDSLTIMQGFQGTSTITTTISGGFNNSIALSASGQPMGVGVTFVPPVIGAPGAGNSTMTITVLRLAKLGTYPITVTGTGGGIQQKVTVTLTIISPQTFTISASPASLTLATNTPGTATITTTVAGGFNNPITLSASGVPSNTQVNFNPTTIPAPGSGQSTMTITVGVNELPGVYLITLQGSGGGIQRQNNFTLTITAGPNFAISATPAYVSVGQGNQGTPTIYTIVCCAFNSSISLSASGAPSGTTVNFDPNPISAPGAGSSTMSVNVGSSTPTGTYPIQVTGSGGGIQQYATVTLTVTGGQTPTDARFMEPYSYALQSSFGSPPYTYQIVSGSLPSGLTMDPSGNIGGSASAVGKFPFQVLATDSSQPPQQQSSNYILNVIIGLDEYSGLTAAPVPGCTPTGYFQTLKVNGRWVYVTPDCNAYYQLALYDSDSTWILPQIMNDRYGNDKVKWATHELQREVSYGYTANDIFASDYMLPVKKYNHDGASVKLPFLLWFSSAVDVISNWDLLGMPEAIKDMCAGQDSNGYPYPCRYTLDTMDPNWLAANYAELAIQQSQFTDPFNTSPWVAAISLGEADILWMFKGNGAGTKGVGTYPHPAMVVATSAFNYNLAPVNGNWQRPILYAKAAWACNAAANDSVNFPPGHSFLEEKYQTIAALNDSWGSNYTSFCDDGGFGDGTGVIDEDGRHTAWFGKDYNNQKNMNPNLQADLNQYLYKMANWTYAASIIPIRSYDTNHLIMCGVFGGTGDGGVRPVVAQAVKDAGCQILVLNWNATNNDVSLAANRAAYDVTGLPVTVFNASSAQRDSDFSNYPYNGVIWADYPTQQIRGQNYNTNELAIYGSQASNGDYFTMGGDTWSLTDQSEEHINFGFISFTDNVYDGNCAVRRWSIDQWGYPCGGEAADYGNFTDALTQTNSTLMQQLIKDLQP
jgi:uncharacterized membrane protein